MNFRAPKYSCTICGKTFRRNKQHYNHVNNAHRNLGTKTNKKQVVVQQVESELVSVKDEFVHCQPQTTRYYGRPYTFNNIPTGNRHLRAGIPLPNNNWTPRQIQAEGIWVRERNTSIPCNWSALTLKKTLDKHYITEDPKLPLLISWNRKSKYWRAAI